MSLNQFYQKSFEGPDISITGNVTHFVVQKAGTLKSIKISVDQPSGIANTKFGLTHISGETITVLYDLASPITLLVDNTKVTISGLSVALLAGDIFILSVESVPSDKVQTPLIVEYEVDESFASTLVDGFGNSLVAGSGITIEEAGGNITISASGGGGPGVQIGAYRGDKPPTSPSGFDDEFNSETLDGWTTIGASDLTVTPMPDYSMIKATMANTGSEKISGIVRAIDIGTNGVVVGRFSYQIPFYASQRVGIMMMETANDSSEIYLHGTYVFSSGNLRFGYITRWTNRATYYGISYGSGLSVAYATSTTCQEIPFGHLYFKVVKYGTNYTVYMSTDRNGIWHKATTTATAITSMTPAYWGLGFTNGNASSPDPMNVYVDWIRAYANITDVPNLIDPVFGGKI